MPESPTLPHSAPYSPQHRLFFVYGTLRKTGANDITLLQPAPQFIGPAQIRGVMVHLGGYPGVTLCSTDAGTAEADGNVSARSTVVGEVYAVSPELEAKLDATEAEYPVNDDEYTKRAITVQINGQSLPCSVYEINPQYAKGKPVIASGDWIKDA